MLMSTLDHSLRYCFKIIYPFLPSNMDKKDKRGHITGPPTRLLSLRHFRTFCVRNQTSLSLSPTPLNTDLFPFPQLLFFLLYFDKKIFVKK